MKRSTKRTLKTIGLYLLVAILLAVGIYIEIKIYNKVPQDLKWLYWLRMGK